MIVVRLISLIVLLLCTAEPVRAQKAPIVAAASDLRFALESIAQRFAEESGQRVELVFGSSGTLTRQIVDGVGGLVGAHRYRKVQVRQLGAVALADRELVPGFVLTRCAHDSSFWIAGAGDVHGIRTSLTGTAVVRSATKKGKRARPELSAA